jgi:hypothetical protein
MISKEKINLLKVILSDSVLVDLDFSKWDKYISFIVISDHYKFETFYELGHRPLLEIKFFQISDLHFEFFHNDKYLFENDPNKHYYWNIDQSQFDKAGKYNTLVFFQNGVMPKVSIKFQEFEIEELDHKYFNTLNPRWKKENSGLARQDIKSIYNKFIQVDKP